MNFVLFAIVLVLASCGKPAKITSEISIQEQLDLGQRYLTELNYEQAIIAFNKVIEIDTKNVAAYEGLGAAYQGQQDYAAAVSAYERVLELDASDRETYQNLSLVYEGQEDIRHAAETLERLIDKFGKDAMTDEETDRLARYYDILAKEAFADGDYEIVARYYKKILQFKSEYNPDEDMQAVLLVNERKTELEDLAGSISVENNYDFHNDTLLSEEFLTIAEALEAPYIFQTDDGLYIGVYPGGYIYYGEMTDGSRSGHGKWIYGNIKRITIADTVWNEDKPNGRAEIVTYRNEAQIEKQEGHTYALVLRETVDLIDGVYEGAATLLWDMDAGDDPQHHWEISYHGGIMQTQDGESAGRCLNCDANLMAGDSVHRIRGIE